jgi:hypothetical protein
MGKSEAPSIEISDFDMRCEKVFPESQERCWGLACKVITFNGIRENICLAHFEEWVAQLIEKGKEGIAKTKG